MCPEGCFAGDDLASDGGSLGDRAANFKCGMVPSPFTVSHFENSKGRVFEKNVDHKNFVLYGIFNCNTNISSIHQNFKLDERHR